MKSIVIGGTKYPVIEDLGYVHSAGCHAAVVVLHGAERVAVKRSGGWSLRPYGEKMGGIDAEDAKESTP